MSKRDYINEILEKKQRANEEWRNGSYKLFELEQSFENLQKKAEVNNFHLSLYLVGIVTCLEISSRQAIQRLVDHGSPYVERIEKFRDYLKFDLTVTKALHDKKVSFGELVSHLLPINNVENVTSHLGVLLNGSLSYLLANLRHFVEPDISEYLEPDEELDFNEFPFEEITEEFEVQEPELLIDDIDKIMSSISKVFELRHIIVHEANFETIKSEDELSNFFTSALKFVEALEELIEQTLNPTLPRSPMILAFWEAKESEKLEVEMNSLQTELERISSSEKTVFGNSEKAAFVAAQKAFDDFLQADISLEEILMKPASGYMLGSINAYISKELYAQRIKRLKEIKDFYFTEIDEN